MSVINKVLQDLEQRDVQNTVSGDYQPPKKSHSKVRIGLVILALICVFGAIWLTPAKDQVIALLNIKKTNQSNSELTENTVKSSVPEPDTNVIKSLPSEITASSPEGDIETVSNDKQTEIQDASQSETVENNQPLTQESQVALSEQGGVDAPMAESEKPTSEEAIETSIMEDKDQASEEGTMTVKVSHSNPEEVLANLKTRASFALRQDNDEEAVTLLEQILKMEPQNIQARKQLASVYFALQQTNSAIQVLSTGISAYPHVLDFPLMLARLYQSQGRNADALALLKNIGSDVVLTADFFETRGVLAQQAEDYALALNDYYQLLNFQPDVAKWWLGHAIAADQLGQTAQALVSYTKASQLGQLGEDVETFIRQRQVVLGGVS